MVFLQYSVRHSLLSLLLYTSFQSLPFLQICPRKVEVIPDRNKHECLYCNKKFDKDQFYIRHLDIHILEVKKFIAVNKKLINEGNYYQVKINCEVCHEDVLTQLLSSSVPIKDAIRILDQHESDCLERLEKIKERIYFRADRTGHDWIRVEFLVNLM